MRISRFTIHDVPLIMPLLSFLFKIGGRLAGWQIFGDVPRDKTIVLIAAPHTSNWDFLIFLYGIFVKRLRINVLAKHTLFWWPLGPVLKFFGCVPVRRTQANNLVDQGIEFLQKAERAVLLITPEGTRSYNDKWKSGFYHMAWGAKVPLVLAKLDCPNKKIFIGEVFEMQGDYEADLIEIRKYFDDAVGLKPENQDVNSQAKQKG